MVTESAHRNKRVSKNRNGSGMLIAAGQGGEKLGESGHLRTEAGGVPLLGMGSMFSCYSHLPPTAVTVPSFLVSLWQFKLKTIWISNCLAFVSVSISVSFFLLCIYQSSIYLSIIYHSISLSVSLIFSSDA